MLYAGGTSQIPTLQIARFSGSGHRMSVPVRPLHTVFAQFRHISGIPAKSGQQTVPLSRVQLLNAFIDGLKRVKNDPAYVPGTMNMSPERVDALIRQYAAELHQTVKTVPESFGTLGSAGAGMVFNITA